MSKNEDSDDADTSAARSTRPLDIGRRTTNRTTVASFCAILSASILACEKPGKELPSESYERPAQEPHNKSDYAFRPTQMPSFYDVPGEFGHYIEGHDYGFEALSFILTETHPCGGPPLHTHDSEEAHVLLEGKASYVIGENRFTIEGPYIARGAGQGPAYFHECWRTQVQSRRGFSPQEAHVSEGWRQSASRSVPA